MKARAHVTRMKARAHVTRMKARAHVTKVKTRAHVLETMMAATDGCLPFRPFYISQCRASPTRQSQFRVYGFSDTHQPLPEKLPIHLRRLQWCARDLWIRMSLVFSREALTSTSLAL